MSGNVEPTGSSLDEQPQTTPALVDREEHPLPVRTEGENAVEPGCDVPLEQRVEGVLVETGAAREQRRDGGCEGSVQTIVPGHPATRCPAMDALRIERDDDVLRVTLTRPETRNAFDATLIEELAEAFVDVGKARAVVLAGAGPSFCAGADIEWMRSSVALSHDENSPTRTRSGGCWTQSTPARRP